MAPRTEISKDENLAAVMAEESKPKVAEVVPVAEAPKPKRRPVPSHVAARPRNTEIPVIRIWIDDGKRVATINAHEYCPDLHEALTDEEHQIGMKASEAKSDQLLQVQKLEALKRVVKSL